MEGTRGARGGSAPPKKGYGGVPLPPAPSKGGYTPPETDVGGTPPDVWGIVETVNRKKDLDVVVGGSGADILLVSTG